MPFQKSKGALPLACKDSLFSACKS